MKISKSVTLFFLSLIVLLSCSKDDEASTNSNQDNTIEANQQVTGSSSNDLLSDATFKSMVVEVVYVEGFKPTQTAINNFVSFLEDRTFKPEGITVETRAITAPGNQTYTIQEIAAIENANRTKYNTSNQIAVFALFIDGESSSNTDNSVVLGTAYLNTSFVIYQETIEELTEGTFGTNVSVLETTVITHEFGHILGLTNLGATLQSDHEDTDHPKHCNVDTCLMYFSAETGSGIMNMVSGGSAPQLDAQCIADLQANGGK